MISPYVLDQSAYFTRKSLNKWNWFYYWIRRWIETKIDQEIQQKSIITIQLELSKKSIQ